MSGYFLETFADVSKFSVIENFQYHTDEHFRNIVFYDDKIYILGVPPAEETARARYMYSWDGSQWDDGILMTGQFNFDNSSFAIVYDNKIHCLGGISGSRQKTSHYSWDGSSWTIESILPFNFAYGSAVIYNNRLHILGSYDSDTKLEHYSWDGTSWVSESTLPIRIDHGCAVAYNNKIYIFKNYSCYSWDGSSWTQESINNLYKFNFYNPLHTTALVYNGSIHLIGGEQGANRIHGYISESNVILDSAKLPDLFDGGCVVYNNEIHIINGSRHYRLFNESDYVIKQPKRAWLNVHSISKRYNEYVLTKDLIWQTDPFKQYYGYGWVLIDDTWMETYYPLTYDPQNPSVSGKYERHPVLISENRKVKKAWICDENNVKKVILEAMPDETIIDKNTPPFFGNDDPVWYMSNNLLTKTNDEIVHLLVPYNNDKHILDSRGYYVIPLWVRNYAYDGNEWTRLEDFGRADMEAGDYAWPDWVVARGKEIYLYFRTLNSYKKRIRYIKEDGTTGTMGNGLSFDGKYICDIISDDTGDRAYEISYTTASNPTYPFSVCTILDYKIKVVGRISKNIIGTAPYSFKCGCAVTRPWSRYIIIFGVSSSNYAPSGVLRCWKMQINDSRIETNMTDFTVPPSNVSIDSLTGSCFYRRTSQYSGYIYVFLVEKLTGKHVLYKCQDRDNSPKPVWESTGIEFPFPIGGWKYQRPKTVVQNDVVRIILSYNNFVLDEDLQEFIPDGFSYSDITTLPYCIENAVTVTYDNKMHIIGSSIPGGYLNHYSWDGTQWIRESILPYAFFNGSAVVYDNKIHIFGGGDSSQYYKAHYSWDGTQWARETDLPEEFIGGMAVVSNHGIPNNDKIYIFLQNGHYYYGNYYNGVFEWTLIDESVPFELNSGSRAVDFNGHVHILSKKLHMIYFGSTQWEEAPSGELPYEFLNGSVNVFNNDELHIFGGTDNVRNHYTLRKGEKEWVKEDDLGYDHVNGCVSSDDYIYVFGGTGPNSMNFEKINVNQYFS